MARQYSKDRGPEEGREAKHAYGLTASTGQFIKTPEEPRVLPTNVFYGELHEGKLSQGDQKKTLQRHPQRTMHLWEKAAKERLKWRGLNKGSTHFEEQRICEAD